MDVSNQTPPGISDASSEEHAFAEEHASCGGMRKDVPANGLERATSNEGHRSSGIRCSSLQLSRCHRTMTTHTVLGW